MAHIKTLINSLIPNLVLAFLILAPTLLYPFFTIDDSDLLNRANNFLETNGIASYFKAFKPGVANPRRYWPGFFVYTLLRIDLLGLNSLLWHALQILLLASVGTLLSLFSRFITGSILPGIAAFIVVLTAGEFTYETNWFAFVFTNSFEPILVFLWAAATGLLTFSNDLKSNIWRTAARTLAVLTVAASITIKENAFMVTGGVSAALLVLTYTPLRISGISRAPLIIIVILSTIWAGIVISLIPRDEGYGGTQSLVTSPGQIWAAAREYTTLIYNASGYFILSGIILGISRIIATKSNWSYFAISILAAVFQLASVLVWPGISLRLIFPAFIALSFLTTVEYCYFIKLMTSGRLRIPVVITFSTATLIAFLIAAQSDFAEFKSFVLVAVIVCSILPVCGLIPPISTERTRALFLSGASGYSIIVLGILHLGLVVNGISHIISYPATYKTTELTRHLTVRQAAALGPPNTRTVWFCESGQEIFPYSCDIHAALFMGREDISFMPAKDLGSEQNLRQGDMFVLYGKYHKVDLKDDKRLVYMPVTQGSYISPILSYGDYLGVTHTILNSKKLKPIAANYYEGTLHMYGVKADSWQIPETLLR